MYFCHGALSWWNSTARVECHSDGVKYHSAGVEYHSARVKYHSARVKSHSDVVEYYSDVRSKKYHSNGVDVISL